MKTLALALATAGLAFTAAPAIAGSGINVTFEDLDLSTVEGQETLDERIESAARQVCGFDGRRTGTRIRSTRAQQCVEQARASVKEQVAAMIQEQQRGG